MELILVRHGETDANRLGILMGSVAGPSLNDTGRAQSAEIAAALRGQPVAHLYTSPARRARETAGIISTALSTPLSVVDALSEIDVGRLEGLTRAEVQQQHGQYSLDWERDAATARPPGGETMQELQARAWQAVLRIAATHPGETVVVVSHLFTILSVVARVLEMPLRHFLRIRLEPGAMARIELGSATSQVISTNETWHLRTRGQDAWRTASSPDDPNDSG